MRSFSLDYVLAAVLVLILIYGHSSFLDFVAISILALMGAFVVICAIAVITEASKALRLQNHNRIFTNELRVAFRINAKLPLFIGTMLLLYAVGWWFWIIILSPLALLILFKPIRF